MNWPNRDPRWVASHDLKLARLVINGIVDSHFEFQSIELFFNSSPVDCAAAHLPADLKNQI